MNISKETDSTHTVTRSDLHALVWQQPMTRVAKRFGISDVAMAKLCDRHDIPRPKQGHWAKLAAGKSIPKKPMPEGSDSNRVLQIAGRARPVRQATPKRTAQNPPVNSAEIATDIQIPALAAAYLDKLKKANANAKGSIELSGKRVFPTKISSTTRERAILMFSDLIRNSIHAGLDVKSTDDGLSFAWEGKTVPLHLSEMLSKVPHTPTPKERRQLQTWQQRKAIAAKKQRIVYEWEKPKIPEHESVPSGRLQIELDPGYHGDGLRRKFRDGKTQTIEQLNTTIVDAIIACAEAARERELEKLRREERWRVAEKQRKEMARIETLHSKRMELFQHFSDQLTRANTIRNEIASYRTEFAQRPIPANVEALLTWLEDQASAHLHEVEPDRLSEIIESYELMNESSVIPSWVDVAKVKPKHL